MCRLLVILLFALSGCFCRIPPPSPDTEESSAWFLTPSASPRGVFLVVHGLNQRPSGMDEIARFLNSLGFHVYRICLKGHARDLGAYVFPASDWRADVESEVAVVAARYPSLPLYFMGYSMGGLLLTDVAEQNPNIHPRKMVLMAPALALQTYVQAARLLSILPPSALRTPNIAPRDYRRYSSTPVFWYTNIIDLYDETQSLPAPQRLASVPTLVIMSPDDELVSDSGLRDWIEEHGLASQWHLQAVTPNPEDSSLPDHLIIDERSLGSAEWQRMKEIIRLFLAAPS